MADRRCLLLYTVSQSFVHSVPGGKTSGSSYLAQFATKIGKMMYRRGRKNATVWDYRVRPAMKSWSK